MIGDREVSRCHLHEFKRKCRRSLWPATGINGSDFSALAANFGQGDRGADVPVSQADIAALDAFASANNLPLPNFASVPEPASAGIIDCRGDCNAGSEAVKIYAAGHHVRDMNSSIP